MKKINYIDSIRNPITTEKATILSEQNKTVFRVHEKANKKIIKRNIEKLFKLNVVKVNIINKHVLRKENTFVIVEQVSAMPGQGVTSMFNFGQTFGSIKGICAALGLPIFYVRPAKWKKHFELINSS